jgi:hypothetical protein
MSAIPLIDGVGPSSLRYFPDLTPAQTLALKRMFAVCQGVRCSGINSTGHYLDPRVARALGTHGLVENRNRTLRTGREEYGHSYLTWKGAYVAWELCGSPALGAHPRWDNGVPTFG